MPSHLTLRPRAELQDIYNDESRLERARANQPAEPGLGYGKGIVAALGWLLGSTTFSPLTNRENVDRAEPLAVDQERLVAVGMLHLEREMDGRGRAYIGGVEAALMWAVGLSDDPP